MPSEERTLLGNALYYTGLFLFPASLGAIAGFWAGDLGLPWLPHMLSTVLGFSLLALVLVLVGRWLRGRLHVETPEGARLSKRSILAMVLLAVALAGRGFVYWTQQPSPLTQLDPADFEMAYSIDLDRYRDFDQSMERQLAHLEGLEAFREGDHPLNPDEERLLRQAWTALYDQSFALDQVRAYYEDWYRFDPSRAQRSYHLRSFLLTYAAELSLYEKSARFTALALRNGDAKKFLDAPTEALPPNSFSLFRQELQGARDQARIQAGREYFSFLEQGLRGRREAEALGLGWLWTAVDRHLARIGRLGLLQQGDLAVRGDLQLFKRTLRRGWYPAQAGVAEWFGDTKTRRIGRYLISPEQVAELDPSLKAGDILVSRKNWYLSNIGLPGFWPHGLLYVGEPDKLLADLDVPEVRAWILAVTGENLSFEQFMSRRHPVEWAAYRAGEGEHPFRVIEAISEGVVLNTLEHAAGDYLAALRPRGMGTLARAQAVVEAFDSLGRPYDFDFDFATDHALVCTELVWRAWRPAVGKEGVDLQLVEVAGRRTLPANDLVRQWAEGAVPLDFVGFYDAREREGKAVRADEPALRASWERMKWDVAQQ